MARILMFKVLNERSGGRSHFVISPEKQDAFADKCRELDLTITDFLDFLVSDDDFAVGLAELAAEYKCQTCGVTVTEQDTAPCRDDYPCPIGPG